MAGANMICPKCKTFQPTAETCSNCGVIVAKLWAAQRHPDDEPASTAKSPRQSDPLPWGKLGAAAAVVGAIGIVAWGALGTGTSLLEKAKGQSPLGQYWDAALDAQARADQMRENLEAEVRLAETGVGYASQRSGLPNTVIEGEIRNLVRDLNAVAVNRTVALEAADVRPVFQRCTNFANRYFKPLRFDGDLGPIPAPNSEPYSSDELEGRYRCEGTRGTSYLGSAPRSQDGLDRCWTKQTLRKKNKKSEKIWVEMTWDEETRRWSMFTVAQQRQADRLHVRTATVNLGDDIRRANSRREERARTKISALAADVEATRTQLTVLTTEANQLKYRSQLAKQERALRRQLVEERYVRICETAAKLGLEAKKQAVAG